jgi:hypothetical protein
MGTNYTSFRIGKQSIAGIRNQLNHDYRNGHIPNYINKDLMTSNISLIDTIRANTVKEKVEASKTLVKEKTKRKAQANAEFMFTGIMTFSKAMKNDYINNPDLFQENAKQFLEMIEDRYDMKCLSAVIHLDETTPHIHLVFDNISQTTGKGIRRKISPNKLSDMQTILGDCFGNMGYSRGEPKEETTAKHIDFKDFHKVEEMVKALKLEQAMIEKVINAYKAGNPTIKKFVDYFIKGKGKLMPENAKQEALKALQDL